MASNTATTVVNASPLAFMTKLSPAVYVFRPAGSSTSEAPQNDRQRLPPPKLILIATWMGARDPHIAKYLAQYRVMFPSSPILLLRSEQHHFFRPANRVAELAPALDVFRSIFPGASTGKPAESTADTGASRRPELLIHAFSNGGATSVFTFRRGLAGGNANFRLPPYALILDSAPGTFRYWPSYTAFTVGVARGPLWRWLLVAPFVHMLCMWYWARYVLQHRLTVLLRRGLAMQLKQRHQYRQGGPIMEVRAGLNDASARATEVRRTYLYGVRDALVDWRDVEAHAEEAERVGFACVRRERLEEGEHVALVRTDAERYWRVVKETWDGQDGEGGQEAA
ncbi:hypothetical protein VTJ04DRAFT_9525 [Mycothermus thermophilus]|uniref:uncharacterized protein n=1 Tax=Humicola insolens TaxID=85995 RepID=UPI003743ED5E